MFKNLHELIATMPDDKACRDYLITERWNGVPVWHVPLHENDFLKTTLGIKDTDGNKGRKLAIKLDELEENGLIRKRISDHDNNGVNISGDIDDNTSITLNKYWFHAELTFKGVEYISNYLRVEQQKKIERSNVTNTIIGLVIAGLTGFFIALTWYHDFNENTSKELKNILQQFQKQDSILNTKQQNYQSDLNKIHKEILDLSRKTANTPNKKPE